MSASNSDGSPVHVRRVREVLADRSKRLRLPPASRVERSSFITPLPPRRVCDADPPDSRLPDDTKYDTLRVMKEVSAAELRQAMGKVAKRLERTGEPILLKLGNKPVGVLVSLRDFEERFTLHAAAARRRALMDEILTDRVKARRKLDDVIDEVRRR